MERSLRMTGIQRFDARKTEYSVSKYIPGIYRIVEIDSRILQGHHAREHMTNRETRGNSIDLATRLQVIMHGASIINHRLSFQPIASPEAVRSPENSANCCTWQCYANTIRAEHGAFLGLNACCPDQVRGGSSLDLVV